MKPDKSVFCSAALWDKIINILGNPKASEIKRIHPSILSRIRHGEVPTIERIDIFVNYILDKCKMESDSDNLWIKLNSFLLNSDLSIEKKEIFTNKFNYWDQEKNLLDCKFFLTDLLSFARDYDLKAAKDTSQKNTSKFIVHELEGKENIIRAMLRQLSNAVKSKENGYICLNFFTDRGLFKNFSYANPENNLYQEWVELIREALKKNWKIRHLFSKTESEGHARSIATDILNYSDISSKNPKDEKKDTKGYRYCYLPEYIFGSNGLNNMNEFIIIDEFSSFLFFASGGSISKSKQTGDGTCSYDVAYEFTGAPKGLNKHFDFMKVHYKSIHEDYNSYYDFISKLNSVDLQEKYERYHLSSSIDVFTMPLDLLEGLLHRKEWGNKSKSEISSRIENILGARVKSIEKLKENDSIRYFDIYSIKHVSHFIETGEYHPGIGLPKATISERRKHIKFILDLLQQNKSYSIALNDFKTDNLLNIDGFLTLFSDSFFIQKQLQIIRHDWIIKNGLKKQFLQYLKNASPLYTTTEMFQMWDTKLHKMSRMQSL